MKFIIIFLAVLCSAQQPEQKKIVFVVLSQPLDYFFNLAKELKQELTEQSQNLHQESPIIHFSHIDFPHIGGWTVFPLIKGILDKHENDASWIIFCQDVTRFNLSLLQNTFLKYDYNKDIWLGHALHDKQPTIIHHFAFFENPGSFLYPNFASGFAISIPLLKRIQSRIKDFYNSDIEFSIDVSHELSMFIWDNGKGTELINEPSFCVQKGPKCASYVKSFTSCSQPVWEENIFYAVKTCKKFHKDRVPIVKNTWGKFAKNITYFSEEKDDTIPTTELKVINTDRGHCAKTIAILHHVVEKMKEDKSILWLVITDDDTIISPSRVTSYLSCFDPNLPVLLGERYGYRAYLGLGRGYNYITGGGGMVLSRELVLLLTEEEVCDCPAPDAPDDMYLGLCAGRIGGFVAHSPAFHQARPPDYADNYLASYKPISFHKHWMIDPYRVYQDWFKKDDQYTFENLSISRKHVEL